MRQILFLHQEQYHLFINIHNLSSFLHNLLFFIPTFIESLISYHSLINSYHYLISHHHLPSMTFSMMSAVSTMSHSIIPTILSMSFPPIVDHSTINNPSVLSFRFNSPHTIQFQFQRLLLQLILQLLMQLASHLHRHP